MCDAEFTSTFFERSNVSQALRIYVKKAVSISLSAIDRPLQGNCNIFRNCSRILSKLDIADRKDN